MKLLGILILGFPICIVISAIIVQGIYGTEKKPKETVNELAFIIILLYTLYIGSVLILYA